MKTTSFLDVRLGFKSRQPRGEHITPTVAYNTDATMARPYAYVAPFVAVLLAIVTMKSQGFVLSPTSCSISGHTKGVTARALLGSSCARPLQPSPRTRGTSTSNDPFVMMAAGEGAGGEEFAADVKVSRKAGKKARAKARKAGKSKASGGEVVGGSAKAGAMAGSEEAPAVSSAVVAEAMMQQTVGRSKGGSDAAR